MKMQDLLSKLYTDDKEVVNEKNKSLWQSLGDIMEKYADTVVEFSQQPS